MTFRQSQEILGLSYRQVLRIKKRFTLEGFEELLRKRPDTPQALKISTSLKEEIINLRRSIYWDFNILHFRWVEICELRDGRIEILLEGRSIGYVEITGAKEKDRHKKKEEILK